MSVKSVQVGLDVGFVETVVGTEVVQRVSMIFL